MESTSCTSDQIWATEDAIKELEKTEKSLTERFGNFCANCKASYGRRASHMNPMMGSE